MWICLNNAFISAVQHRDMPNHLMVRARRREHLETIFPVAHIMEMGFADYRWRVTVSKSEFKNAVNKAVDSIDYDNFKKSVFDKELHEKYTSIWSMMCGLQED